MLSLIGQIVLVVTGGAVRLTASGLGCPTWPRCTEASLATTPEMGFHGIIEFGNRLLTFALAAIAVMMLVYLWNLRKERRDLFLLALGLLASIPAQAVIGGITVLTQLNPWVVGLHFLVSMALVVLATLLVNRAYGRTGKARTVQLPALPGAARPVMTAVALLSAVAVCLGVVVTGAGPHAGDANAPRNNLDWDLFAHIHAVPAYLVTAGALFAVVPCGPRADPGAVPLRGVHAPGRHGAAGRHRLHAVLQRHPGAARRRAHAGGGPADERGHQRRGPGPLQPGGLAAAAPLNKQRGVTYRPSGIGP